MVAVPIVYWEIQIILKYFYLFVLQNVFEKSDLL